MDGVEHADDVTRNNTNQVNGGGAMQKGLRKPTKSPVLLWYKLHNISARTESPTNMEYSSVECYHTFSGESICCQPRVRESLAVEGLLICKGCEREMEEGGGASITITLTWPQWGSPSYRIISTIAYSYCGLGCRKTLAFWNGEERLEMNRI